MITHLLHKLIPTWIHQRLIGDWDSAGFKKYLKNTGWIFIAKVVTLIVSFFTMAIVARYLGPENLGKLSYAQSFTALFSVFATLGINQILYRELISKPEQSGKLLGTAILTKFVFGIVTLLVTIAIAHSINTDPVITWLVGITALTFIFQPFGTVAIIFNARVQAKYPAYVTIESALIITVLKLLIIFFDKGIIFFAAIIAFEALFFALVNMYLFLTVAKQTIKSLKFSYPMFKYLLSHSWPLMLVGATNYIYARVDQLMLQHFLNAAAVGFYDIAVRLTELLGFIPGMIIGSLFPAIINAKKTNYEEYIYRFRALVFLCLGISITLASILYLLAPWIVYTLFGDAFEKSVEIVRIYVWSNLGIIVMMLVTQYLIAEKKSRLMLIFTVFGAVCNVILNILLIPRFGTVGAAYATVATLAFMVILFIIIHRRLVR